MSNCLMRPMIDVHCCKKKNQIQIAARETHRGPSGAVIWGVSALVIGFGFYRVRPAPALEETPSLSSWFHVCCWCCPVLS